MVFGKKVALDPNTLGLRFKIRCLLTTMDFYGLFISPKNWPLLPQFVAITTTNLSNWDRNSHSISN